MPAAPRPNKKAAKILYTIKQTPKDLQQSFGLQGVNYPGEDRIKRWKKDSEIQR